MSEDQSLHDEANRYVPPEAAAARETLDHLPWDELSVPVDSPQAMAATLEERYLGYHLDRDPRTAEAVWQRSQQAVEQLRQTWMGEKLPTQLNVKVVAQLSTHLYEDLKREELLDEAAESFPTLAQPPLADLITMLKESGLPGGVVSVDDPNGLPQNFPHHDAGPLPGGVVSWVACGYEVSEPSEGYRHRATAQHQILLLLTDESRAV